MVIMLIDILSSDSIDNGYGIKSEPYGDAYIEVNEYNRYSDTTGNDIGSVVLVIEEPKEWWNDKEEYEHSLIIVYFLE